MIQTYRSLFKDVPTCALITSIASFILYLLLFMGVCYGFTWMPDDTFNQKFEKYFTLAIAIFMIFPFVLSNLLVHFVLTFVRRQSNKAKSEQIELGCNCLLLWLKFFISTTAIFTAAIIAAGIYTIVEGTLYVGIVILVSGLILGVFKLHTILIVAALRQDWMESETPRTSSNSNESANV